MEFLSAVRTTIVLMVALIAAGCGGGPEGEVERVTVPPGASMSMVTDTLTNREIIRWPAAFRVYTRFRGVARSIKPGVYEFQRGTSWAEVVDRLVRGDVIEVTVVVPEGWTSAQIGQRIANALGVPEDSVAGLLADTAMVRRLEIPGPSFEGYLYPATYRFPITTSPAAVIQTLVRRYQQLWTAELRARADSLGLSEREVVTLASIVEKEARVWTERDTIAGVFHNRLRIGMPLQADPTIQYALGSHQTRLLYSHIRDVRDNPYNTYTHRGLPPGPIASPSTAAIRATLYPADVPYFYFVAEPGGRHIFTRTLAEHNAARRRVAAMRDNPAE
jgi:UPF0755 protein